MLEIPVRRGQGTLFREVLANPAEATVSMGPLSMKEREGGSPSVTSVLVFRVSTLRTEFLPLLSVSFVSENSVVAAVSICRPQCAMCSSQPETKHAL